MLSDTLREIYARDLSRFREEISLYTGHDHLWRISKDINNSAGTIALHLLGNLNHWIGNIIGGSGYVRNRDAEFTIRDVPCEEILKLIDDTISVVDKALAGLKEEDFLRVFPSDVLDKEVTTDHFLIYLISHLNYHVGQINYHRRLLK